MRGNGERIGPQNLPTSSIAGGIWNLLNQQRAQQRGAWPSATPAVVTDPYFMYVPLLLNTTSTNGQQNNTFLDSSSNAFTITRNGTPTQGAFTPYQPSGYWSAYFPGNSSSYLSVADNAAFNFTTGSWTIEAWAYPTARSATYGSTIVSKRNPGSPFTWAWDVSINPSGYPALLSASITSSILAPLNTWTHIAAVSNGSTITLYVNGVVAAGPTAYTVPSTTGSVYIGNYPTDNPFFNGYISNVRIVKGVAVYTGAFTPPTTPLASTQSAGTNIAAITGTATSLLTNQSNRFVDNSSNAFTVTVNGTTSIQAFQPFAPAASYSAATYGGSGYFGASTQYLTLGTNTAFNPGSGDFTFECWAYAISSPASSSLFEGTSNGLSVTFDATNHLAVANSGVAYLITDPATFSLTNQWVHIVAVRSGTNLSLYKNGSRVATSASNSTNLVSSTQNYIGLNGGSAYFPGYISNLRLVKGTAVYDPTQTTLTVPTTPLTAVSGTSLLTNFGNAGIYDAAWQNNALTVGDAQVSTTQKQWGTTSMKFDGTVDALSIPSSTSFGLGTGDWTIEFWLYLNATTAQTIVSMSTTTGVGVQPHIYYANGSGIRYYVSAADRITGGALSTGVWYYIAVVKASNVTKMYINGTQTGSNYTDTNNYGAANPLFVGDYAVPLVGSLTLNGYIQDLRITKGVARTITTPTAAFPTR